MLSSYHRRIVNFYLRAVFKRPAIVRDVAAGLR